MPPVIPRPIFYFIAIVCAFARPCLALPRITVAPWADATEETYDPAHPPDDLPPVRSGHAEADAQPWVTWEGAALDGHWDAATKMLVITEVGDVTLAGHTTIRVPEHVSDTLRAHEYGHDALNANEYFRSARVLFGEATRALTGMKFTGEGNDDDARRRDAWAKANAERDRLLNEATAKLTERMDALSDLYDDATAHGRSRLVNTQRGIEIALQKRDHPPATRPATRPATAPGR